MPAEGDHEGLSCIQDWGCSESQVPPAQGHGTFTVQAVDQQVQWSHDAYGTRAHFSQSSASQTFAAPVGGTGPHVGLSPVPHEAVGHCPPVAGTSAHHRSYGPSGDPFSSPLQPVGGFRFGVGGEDEYALREQLRRRAMAMAGASESDLQHSPACFSRELFSGQHRNSDSLPPDGQPVTPISPQAPTPQTRCHSSGGGDGGQRQQGGEDYIINRLIRNVEAGDLSSQDCGAGDGHRVGQPSLSPFVGASPSEGDNLGASGGSPNVPAGVNAPQPIPSPPVSSCWMSTAARHETSAGRPSPADKSSDRWGEEETAVLCRIRNEVKQLMGEETDAYGRDRIKSGFWKMVAQRMKENGVNRSPEQCKNKFNQVHDFYRRLKGHERWSSLPSYWDMNASTRKVYNVDFIIRRSWYDAINSAEKDTDSITLSDLRDLGTEHERREEEEGAGEEDGQAELPTDEDGPGAAGGPSVNEGTRSTAFDPMLGKRKRAVMNARESSMRAITGAMRDHTVALARSDRDCARIRYDATRDVAAQQAELQQDIASRERTVKEYGDRVENAYMAMADAIRSLRAPHNNPRDHRRSSDDSE
ncbi:hypothetical protein CBR_g27820 [Chara braunii]|uniref:Myb-like domain-containing protein n=1 Tax=Chara braunii TaxID=69332 RepID=A0A388L8G0_CHABU|nr:hypothetical protein CBR_g27820 [Chara braunii]|eukprot:GBG78595.1 hypothetical protein CBR_g27820 [Chara braunii]